MTVEVTEKDQNYGSTRYITRWTLIISLGLALEFVARFLGYAENPLNFYHPLIPAFTGISASLLLLAGYFMIMSEKSRRLTMYRRNAVMVAILGLFMLGSFFIFKEIIPLIFEG